MFISGQNLPTKVTSIGPPWLIKDESKEIVKIFSLVIDNDDIGWYMQLHDFFINIVMVGWERNNKYRLCNNQEQQFMYAKEGKLFPTSLYRFGMCFEWGNGGLFISLIYE